jgi:hypothetical protein
MVILLAVATLLSTCVYVPWPGEIKAKHVALDKVRSMLESLPRPGDFKVAKFPGTDADDVLYSGNYRGRYASVSARYLTDLSPEATCEIYLRFLQTQPKWADDPPACGTNGPYVFIDMVRLFPKWHQDVHFRVTINVRTVERFTPEREAIGTEILVGVHYALDERAQAACIPDALTGRPPPCAEADWKLRD